MAILRPPSFVGSWSTLVDQYSHLSYERRLERASSMAAMARSRETLAWRSTELCNAPKRKSTATQNQEGSAAADELDDFVPVACGDAGIRPFGAGQDFEVALDGDAAGLEAQFAEKIRNRGVRLCGASLSVDGNGDGCLHLQLTEGTRGLARN